MLHLLALPPKETELLAQAVSLIGTDDTVVFLDQGLALLQDQALLARLRQCECYVWSPDADPAGNFSTIDAEGLVALSEQHPTCLSWYPEAQ